MVLRIMMDVSSVANCPSLVCVWAKVCELCMRYFAWYERVQRLLVSVLVCAVLFDRELFG